MNRSHKILHIAAEAGTIILQSGGETYRVEETMLRICYAFNIKKADSFVTPTGIMISITDQNNQTISLVRRINSRTVNLEKVCMVNDLSRSIIPKKLTLDCVESKLKEINSTSGHKSKVLIVAASFAAGFFTLVFGGSVQDFLVSLVIGAIIKILSTALNNIRINEFFINSLGGAVAALIALISVKFNLGHSEDKIIIGSIMLLVPGLAITNAIRDTIAGDLISGISRAIEAFFIAIAVAIGSGLVIKLWVIAFGGIFK
ncbi:threonine/serine exporter family protein [Clostridium ganghwense]|uniref:Threonine/serine exporter family protein n=1 Tax=Clostridium ganghwense TaxID=312089 RepID=A0ABT4CN09_9CLOT|nr:threonine/serine exporter family protein [Clostridium ganghwense]MCY6370448.1 threonine/serine exporter family protein [Clostridium ganghwense]